MKTWPIIRHIRAIRAWIEVDEYYAFMARIGYLPVYRDADEEHVRRIWRGEA